MTTDPQTTRYRKLPVEIEAVQYGLAEYADNPWEIRGGEIPQWLQDAARDGIVVPEFRSEDYWYLKIKTLEGDMYVSPDDWIIRGVKGELYPCKPDIFRVTHEPTAPVATPVPVVRPELRDQIAEALARVDGWEWADGFKEHSPAWQGYQHRADAVVAVLPPPADRAAVLREEAARIRAHCPDHLDSESAVGSWMACHCAVADDMERRMAVEAQQQTETPHPPHDSWLVEWCAEGGDWAVAYPTHDRSKALDRLARGRRDTPEWQWRLVRETASYTVEQPAVVAAVAGEAPFVTRVLDLFAKADCHGELLWRIVDGQPEFSADVSDVFAWGGADCEDVTPDTMPVLEQAFVELKALGAEEFIADLYAARLRKMRPQGAAYPSGTHKAWREVSALYDACGPERELGLGNPKAAPAHRAAERQPVRHAPGIAILCADCHAKGHAVCMDAAVSQPGKEPRP